VFAGCTGEAIDEDTIRAATMILVSHSTQAEDDELRQRAEPTGCSLPAD
jgi:hypothetical protein